MDESYQDYIDNTEQDIHLLRSKGSHSSANILENHLDEFKKEHSLNRGSDRG